MSQSEGATAVLSPSYPATKSPTSDPVKHIDFNQDFTSLCVGTENGYQIIDFDGNVKDELKRLCNNSATNCYIVVRLYTSSLVAFVSETFPRRLHVNHFKKDSSICAFTYVSSILKVLLNRDRLIVVCEEQISVHVVKDMDIIHTIADTPPNRLGVCALANDTTNCFLAYPASSTAGIVQVFDAFNLKALVKINAHESPLQCIAFNCKGTKLATASVKGTVIRVFDVSHEDGGKKLFELRRGISRSVSIFCLNFSHDNNFLVASSNTETVHVFRLLESPPEPEEPQNSSYVGSMFSMLSGAVSASAAYLPSQVAGMMIQERAFAWATLPSIGKVTKAALTRVYKIPRLIVVTLDGMIYIYDFNEQLGGECKLIRQHNLNPTSEAELSEDGLPSIPTAESDSERSYAVQKAAQPPPTNALPLDDPKQFPPV